MKAFCDDKCLSGGNPCFWLNLVKQGKFKEAWLEIVKYNPLPAVTGKVCPHPCEDVCKRVLLDESIAINSLEGYLGELALANGWQFPVLEEKPKNFSVAIVGSGPAGLSCAYQLARKKIRVNIFEQSEKLGGMLRLGIPDFRLPRDILDEEIDNIINLGVSITAGVKVDSEFREYFKWAYDAIFFAVGLQKSRKLNIPGEKNNPNVLYGLDFLKDINLGKNVFLGDEVIVIGGGNTAIDVARTAKRLGSRVRIFYRRTKAEMPAIESEVRQVEKEEIDIIEQLMPTGICWKVIAFQKTKLGEIDETGRRKFIPIEGTDCHTSFSRLIIAAGEEKGEFLSFISDNKKVFVVEDEGTVAEAIKAGREAAEEIIKALEPETENIPVLPENPDFYSVPRNRVAINSPQKAEKEAKRCFGCGFEAVGSAEVLIDKERCKGCKLCCDVCPYRVLEIGSSFNKQGYLPAVSKNPLKCRGCSFCALICPDAAIEVRRC